MFSGRSYVNTSIIISLFALSVSSWAATIEQQRSDFKQAAKLSSDSASPRYQQLKQQLVDYPLYPYLDYYEVRNKIKTIDTKQLHKFIDKHADMPIAGTLIHRRLTHLGKTRQWQEYLDTAKQVPHNKRLACYYYTAQLHKGDRQQAYHGAEQLWLTGKSQDDACDPLFKQWNKDGKLTAELIWQRQQLAAKANNISLVKYLDRRAQGKYNSYSKDLIRAYQSPRHFNQPSSVNGKHDIAPTLITTAARRLAYLDPEQARRLWLHYPNSVVSISASERAAINQHIATRLLRKSADNTWAREQASKYSKQYPRLAEQVLQQYLGTSSWQPLQRFINGLPDDVRHQQRWQYWLARSQEKQKINPEHVAAIYRELSHQRHYYGFLAAERIKRPVHFQHVPYRVASLDTASVKATPAFQRIEELLAIGYNKTASKEWRYLLANISAKQQPALGQLAIKRGWGNYAIRQAAQQQQLNNLGLRAPLAFEQTMRQAAKKRKIDPSWAFSIARQESLFNSSVHSSAGAIGLMQLMPSTAKDVAKDYRIPFRNRRDLEKPEVNIALGTSYLAQLQERFKGNRVYATAAYNAGPNRVSQWLKQRPNLDDDVWTETVPFTETRNYVKNVAAFAKIYDYQLSHHKQFSVYQLQPELALNKDRTPTDQ
ncbi:transglycosylase SLT domain-containing protein [Sinobacterium caligoides]|nr:transglycosylase SLT domain-containing protein [Sinobacterium caligoides]